MVRKLVLLTMPCVVLAGCGTLPNAGPSADTVVDRQLTATASASGPVRNYSVLEIDPRVIDIMKTRRSPSFYARFADYRPSVAPRIEVGDVLSLTIYETSPNGLFTAPLPTDRFTTGAKSATLPDQPVGRDGTITVPYAGRIRVAGLPAPQAQAKIEEALKGKAIQPQVVINITHPVGDTVTVTGEVGTSARVPLTNKGDRVLDVLASAGGARIPVDDASVQLSRGNQTIAVPLYRVIANPRENIFMRPGDTMTIIRRPETFMGTGASGRNEEISFGTDRLMLSQAIAKMGGLLDSRADPAGVFVFRYEPTYITSALGTGGGAVATPIAYRLNLRDPNTLFLAQQFPIFDKDVIYISDAPILDLNKAASAVGAFLGPATRASVAAF